MLVRKRMKLLCLLCLCIVTFSCTKQKTATLDETTIFLNTSDAFTPVSIKKTPIQNPVHTWRYHWKEKYEKVLQSGTSICLDEDGTAYFIGNNFYLYSVSSEGKENWHIKLEPTSTEKIHIVKEGLLFLYKGRLTLWNRKGELIRSSEKTTQSFSFYNNCFLTPNLKILNIKLISGDAGIFRIASLNANLQEEWAYTGGPIHESLDFYSFESCFFDASGNCYILFHSTDTDTKKYSFAQYSFTPEGSLRWKKWISDYQQLTYHPFSQFVPSTDLFDDIFLLSFKNTKSEENSKENIEDSSVMIAYNTDGEEIWQLNSVKEAPFESYAVGKDGMLFVPFTDKENDECLLRAISKDGKVIWEYKMTGGYPGPKGVILDEVDNLYIGYQGEIYSFTSDGNLRWKLPSEEYQTSFNYDFVLGNGRIYFTTVNQSLIFCVEELP